MLNKFRELNYFVVSYFAFQKVEWVNNNRFDRELLPFAAVFVLAALMVFILGGLPTGFFPVQAAGLAIMPPLVWENITFIGDTSVTLTIALIFSVRYPQLAVALLISAVMGSVEIRGFKTLFSTLRPAGLLGENLISVIGPVLKHTSMPSGHTMTAFILVTLLTRCLRSQRNKYFILLAACLVGWSRVVCGAHWPADVLAGAGLGIFTGWLGLKCSDRISLGLSVYLAGCIFMLASAFILFDFTGGFAHTRYMAHILSVAALFYWILSWCCLLVFRPAFGAANENSLLFK